jgi:putative folate metabolism gamma-glutamate ligase
MYIRTIKTHRIEINESLEDIIDKYLCNIKNEDILIVTSKILSIIEGSIIKKDLIDKYDLIKEEADYILETDRNPYNIYLTIKNNILIPSAGIDESNADNIYVLYPKNIQKTANFIWEYLRKKHNLKNFGVVITDSHTTIMRKGVTGIALGWCGFEPLYSYIDKPDIYGNPLKMTQMNILDSLAGSGVFMMGEGDEQTPFAIIQNAPKISFVDRIPTQQEENSIKISIGEDLYSPLLLLAKWFKKDENQI